MSVRRHRPHAAGSVRSVAVPPRTMTVSLKSHPAVAPARQPPLRSADATAPRSAVSASAAAPAASSASPAAWRLPGYGDPEVNAGLAHASRPLRGNLRRRDRGQCLRKWGLGWRAGVCVRRRRRLDARARRRAVGGRWEQRWQTAHRVSCGDVVRTRQNPQIQNSGCLLDPLRSSFCCVRVCYVLRSCVLLRPAFCCVQALLRPEIMRSAAF